MIKFSIGNADGFVRQWGFPAGEVGVGIPLATRTAIESTLEGKHCRIEAQLQDSDDVMALLMTVDAIKRGLSPSQIELYLPYVPYGRQDRVCNDGESLSISVFAGLLNSCGFSKVTILDPHSEATAAAINNSCVVTIEDIMYTRMTTRFINFADTYVVAPDAGAYKKAHKVATKLRAAGVITAHKVRNLSDGKIESVTMDQDVTGKRLLVVDDICDGGGTFVMLRQAMDDAPEEVRLWVTHGIFSKGVEVVTDIYDKVYTTNSYTGFTCQKLPENFTVFDVF